jgi:hypothetical protein
MSCILRAHGESFQVHEFLKESSLQADTVFEKGDPIVTGQQNGSRLPFSGFTVLVSRAGISDLEGQVREAILFLDEYEDELRRLGSFSGVDGISLEFSVELRDTSFPSGPSPVVDRGEGTGYGQTPAQTDVFPADLLWRAGALDIWLAVTHYFIVGRKDDAGAARQN